MWDIPEAVVGAAVAVVGVLASVLAIAAVTAGTVLGGLEIKVRAGAKLILIATLVAIVGVLGNGTALAYQRSAYPPTNDKSTMSTY
jgi:hypothetical protein